MLGNAFKKDEVPQKKEAAPHQAGSQPASESSDADVLAWREKIAAARDEQALLQLARQAPGVELKLAVVAALTQEDALKQAMREFRDQDKRLYRAAKARWQEAVERREAAAEAPLLIASARALIELERIPANRLVELDRAWEALNLALLDEALVSEFSAVRAQLLAKARQHGESEPVIARWLAA